MRVAIIGGGSAGLVTAYLLDRTHDVTVLEKQPILGGHVRTLNGNVLTPLPSHLRLDAGVIEFETRNFPQLMRLFDELGCETRPVRGTTTFYSADGHHHLSPGSMQRAQHPWPQRIRELVDLVGMRVQGMRFEQRTDVAESLAGRPLGDFLTDAPTDRWLALLTTYAYSIPYERVRQVPAALAVPMLHAFLHAESWVSLVGGAWCYLDRILAGLRGPVHTDAHLTSVARDERGVTLTFAGGERARFDKVVFACPPDQTLALLADPSEAEVRRFGAWRANHVHTLVHTDRQPYDRRKLDVATEFDVFELGSGRGGYNAYLNELCGLPADGPQYGLAFGMDEEIRPETVLHRQPHHTPDYTVEAYRWCSEIRATNGERHTLHAGAWLGNGLQEGAICSALAVSDRLGGHRL